MNDLPKVDSALRMRAKSASVGQNSSAILANGITGHYVKVLKGKTGPLDAPGVGDQRKPACGEDVARREGAGPVRLEHVDHGVAIDRAKADHGAAMVEPDIDLLGPLARCQCFHLPPAPSVGDGSHGTALRVGGGVKRSSRVRAVGPSDVPTARPYIVLPQSTTSVSPVIEALVARNSMA